MENKRKVLPFKVIIMTIIATMVMTLIGIKYSGMYTTDSGVIPHGDHTHEDKNSLYTCSMHPFILVNEPGDCPVCGMDLIPKKQDKKEAGEPAERKIAFWKAPMNPTEIYNKPGKSAMGMELVPVYEDEIKGGVDITIDPVTQQNMGLRKAVVKQGSLSHTIRTFGHLTYDERKTVIISPRYSGWVEKLYVNFEGQQVKKGTPLFTVYSPELVTAEEEYLDAFRNYQKNKSAFNKKFLKTVKMRLLNYEISLQEIKKIEKTGKASNRITIRSPFTGVITEKNIVEGGAFKAGTNIYSISDLSTIWVEAHIYEYEMSTVKTGLPAEMTLPYLPGKLFKGSLTYVYPYMQKQTRDVVVRLEFDNSDFLLKPNMYADVSIKVNQEKAGLVIPEESVIRSGEKNIVFVVKDHGKFIPRNVTPGLTLDNGKLHVMSGLAPGDVIVTSGQFLLDSESKLKEAVAKMIEQNNPAEKQAEEASTPAADDGFFDDI